jgi:adenine phosphoribosyltransferase
MSILFSEEYQLEYGTDILEVDVTAIKKNDNILVIDDLIATGGTAIATGNLINKFSANIHEYTFLINLPDLGGAKKLIDSNYNVYSLMEFTGE